jgi:Tol biopolymer transport system component
MAATIRICLTSLLTFLIAGCGSSKTGQHSTELILFTTIGNRPFSDSISTVEPDGSNVNRILPPHGRRSYLHASGNSLQKSMTLLVHELNLRQQVEDHIFIYQPGSGKWNRLLTMEGLEGSAYMSPDDKHVAFVFAPQDQRSQLRLWVADLETTEFRRLTTDNIEQGAWEGYASWRPDGQEIAFIRLGVAQDGVETTLMRVPLSGGEPAVLLGPGTNEVTAVCYAPDGQRLALMTKEGLELLDLKEQKRTVIRPWSEMPNKQFQTGGLAWLRTQDKIAFTLFDNQTHEYEIWTVPSSGRDAKKIYRGNQADGRVVIMSSINN